jgi:hypothetical protein
MPFILNEVLQSNVKSNNKKSWETIKWFFGKKHAYYAFSEELVKRMDKNDNQIQCNSLFYKLFFLLKYYLSLFDC